MPDDLPLGRETDYPETYDPDLLRSIPRADARRDAGIQEPLPFDGVDIWNAYEISWLDQGGKPTAYVGELSFPATSTNIVESKSLKLYLNSLSHERHACADNVAEVIRQDLFGLALGDGLGAPHEGGHRRSHHVRNRQSQGYAETSSGAEVRGDGLEEDTVGVEEEPDRDEVDYEYRSDDAPAVEAPARGAGGVHDVSAPRGELRAARGCPHGPAGSGDSPGRPRC